MRGFTTIELLIAMGIVLSLAAVLAGATRPARDAFERVPAELDLYQRARTAIDALVQPVRSSLAVDIASDGRSITVTVPVAGGRAVLGNDQATPGDPLNLSTTPCPNLNDLCGFGAGGFAFAADRAGHADFMTIAAVSFAPRLVIPARALSTAYAAGATLTAADRLTFRLAPQADGSVSLVRQTAAGAVQPIVDLVSDLSCTTHDGQIDIAFRVHAPAGARVPSQWFRAVAVVRNVS